MTVNLNYLSACRNKTIIIDWMTPNSGVRVMPENGTQACLKVSCVRWVMDRQSCRV